MTSQILSGDDMDLVIILPWMSTSPVGWRGEDSMMLCRLDEKDSRIDNVKFSKIHYLCALHINRVKYMEHIDDYRIIYFWFMWHIPFLVCLYITRNLSFKKELHTNWNFQINTSILKSSLTSIIEKPSHQHSSPQLMFVGKASRICWGLFVVEPNKHKASAEKLVFFSNISKQC